MTALKNPVTGHQITVDEESTDFWKAAGYRDVEKPKKASAKKASSSKSDK